MSYLDGENSPQRCRYRFSKKWIHKLKETLNPKTIREVVTRLATIHAIWRHEHQISYNPFESINIQQLDGPEPDPFTKTEIALILNTPTDLDIENLLPCIMWTGLSISEQLPIAWEDIDLDKGLIYINRSFVKNIYRVTKNRRRKRELKLLKPAIDALRKQYKITGHYSPKIINVLQRDNQTYKKNKSVLYGSTRNKTPTSNTTNSATDGTNIYAKPMSEKEESTKDATPSPANFYPVAKFLQNGLQISLGIQIHP